MFEDTSFEIDEQLPNRRGPRTCRVNTVKKLYVDTFQQSNR